MNLIYKKDQLTISNLYKLPYLLLGIIGLFFILISPAKATILSIDTPNTTVFEKEEELANEIYHKLKARIGDKRKQWPELKIWGLKEQGATFIAADNTIYLDQVTVNICKSFGTKFPDALAFIIGHELTHFYQAHDWKTSGFVSHFLINEADFALHQSDERQADIYGAFIAQQAGYQSIKLVPSLLDSIYANYAIDKNDDKQYPPLSERKKMAAAACQLANNLLDTYHTANYAMVIGKYEEAHLLYQHVSQHLKFKELFFNIGMSNLLGYYYWDRNNDLVYNFEIDPKIPMTRSNNMRHPNTLLKEAISAFKRVNQTFDPHYYPSKLHLITAYDWQKNSNLAEREIALLQRNVSQNQEAALLLTIGNYYARNQQLTKSKEQFNTILTLDNLPENYQFLAKHNLNFLETGQSNRNQRNKRRTLLIEEGIDKVISLDDFEFDEAKHHKIVINRETNLLASEQDNSYLTKLAFGNDLFKLQRVYSNSISTNEGIRIGSTIPELISKYPNKTFGKVGYAEGYYMVIYEKGLIFKCSYNGIIEEWSIFSL